MDDSRTPMLEYLTWNEAQDLLSLRPVGLLPVGAIEAHGPHLPLNSDVIIARGMAAGGGRQISRIGIPCVILPAISYSVSFAGACFAGTTPVPFATFADYLTQILASHASQGYRALCVCNAHLEPQHIEAVHEAVAGSSETVGIPICFPDQRQEPWATRLGDEFQRGARHAGSYETSIVMAEAPELVRRTTLEELEPVWIDLPAALRSGARDFAEAGAAQGYFGDPAAATAEYGNELLEQLGAMICEHVVESLARNSS